MRHNNKINHLGRTHSHREAMLSNMAVSLLMHKRIFTTVAKAKELRKYVEPLITKGKEDTTHSRRVVFQNLRDKYAVTELFQEISQKIGDRPGGYTRIIKTGNRLGDNASMCFIELVDYNELMLKDKKAPAKGKTRRSRRKSDVATAPIEAPKAAPVKEKKAKAVVEKEQDSSDVRDSNDIKDIKDNAVEAVADAAVEEVQAAEVPEVPAKEEPEAEAPETPPTEASETEETKE